MTNNDVFKIRHYVKSSINSNYVFDGQDMIYSRDELIDFIDEYSENDTFLISLFHEYELDKQDVIALLSYISNLYIETISAESHTVIRLIF